MKQSTNQLFDTFTVSSIINLVRNQSVPDWSAANFYSVGNQIRVHYRRYVAINNGNSGQYPPSHTSGIALDNQVQWLYIGFDSISDLFGNNIYIGFGTSNNNWYNNPDDVYLSDYYSETTKNNLVALFKLTNNDVRIGIKRIDWRVHTRFAQYDPFKEIGDYDQPHYCLVGTDIYKCLHNNYNNFSRQQPTGRSINSIIMPDGYIWKYIGTVDPTDEINFMSNTHVPVKKSVNADQSGVELSAQKASLSTLDKIVTNNQPFTNPISRFNGTGTGAHAFYNFTSSGHIDRVFLVNAGEGYHGRTFFTLHNDDSGHGAEAEATVANSLITNITITQNGTGYTNATVLIVGDGNNASAVASITAGSITGITITNMGHGYTWARVIILPGTAGLAAYCIPAPYMGHGHDIIRELAANELLISKRVGDMLAPYVVNADYNEVSLVTSINTTNESDVMAIGPKHPDYNEPSSSLNKYYEGTGKVIYKSNIPTINYIHHSTHAVVFKLNISFDRCESQIVPYSSDEDYEPPHYSHGLTPNGISSSFAVNDVEPSEIICTLPEDIQIGDPIAGGYFAGIIDTTQGNIHANDAYQVGERYALILSPKSLETYAGTWNNIRSDDHFARSRWNGLAISNALPSTGSYSALRYAKGLSYDSYPCASGWYLPAMDELELIYRNFKPSTDENSTNTNTGLFPGSQQCGSNPSTGDLPYTISNPLQTTISGFQEGGSQSVDRGDYWSSTCVTDDGSAWTQEFNKTWLTEQGEQIPRWKNTADIYVRPVRRITLG